MTGPEIALAITRFERQCEAEQHTDTERAWELLREARRALGGVKLPPVPASPDVLVAWALDYLIWARELLKEANAPKALERVRLAISSAKGAKRHADLAPFRQARQ